MIPTLQILSSSTRYARNLLREQWQTNRINVYLGVSFAFLFSLGLFVFFFYLFRSVVRLETIGNLLLDRLLGMFFLVTFSMLIFSNLVVAMTTLYRSQDLEFLMVQPLQRSAVFWAKYWESLFFSSWPFVYLFLPMFLAYGTARGFSPSFYPCSVLAFLPFLFLAASLGQFLTLIIAGLLPARRGLWASAGVAVIFLVLVAFRVFARGTLLKAYRSLDFETILASLRIGGNPWLPTHWMTQALLDSAAKQWSEFTFHLGLLAANAALAMEIVTRLSERLFYNAWTQAREDSGGGTQNASKASTPVRFTRALLSFLPKHLRGLAVKDLFTFARDPWQWTQFAILFGLLAVYLFNLRSTPLAQFIPFWRHLVSFFNLGATAFIFSIISTRFVYPLPSLEGGMAWLWCISRMKRTTVIWQKFSLSWATSFLFALALLLATSYMLEESKGMVLLSACTLTLLSLGLTSIAIGLGASYPNFYTNNPAKIANGIGGVITIVLSMTYVVMALVVEAVSSYLVISGKAHQLNMTAAIVMATAVYEILLHACAIVIPMVIGLRKWRKQEF